MLAKAAQQGQRIYHITQANMATVLPNIHHDSLVMDEIRAALAVGKEVTTHTDAVSVPGWTGAGYIIMDAETGVGAYKIGGGENGSFLLGLLIGAAILSMIALSVMLIVSSGLAGAAVVAFVVAEIAPVLAFAASNIVNMMKNMDDATRGCFVTGVAIGLAGLSLLFGNFPGVVIAGRLGTILGMATAITDTTSIPKCFGAS